MALAPRVEMPTGEYGRACVLQLGRLNESVCVSHNDYVFFLPLSAILSTLC